MTLRLSAFLLAQRILGSRAADRYREFQRLEKSGTETSSAWKQTQLATLLRHAVAEIPFYRARAAGSSSLADFPIVTKRDLAAHYSDFMSADLRAEYEGRARRARYGWIEVKTGGSTGVPATVIHDADFRDRDRAARLLEFDLCGFPFGTPHYRLWGAMADINRAKTSRNARAMAWLANETLLNAFRMEDARIVQYLDQIATGGIRYAIGYVDALYQLARFAERTVRKPKLEAVVATAGTLTDEMRTTIARVFGARVHNKYGSREAGDIACECEHGGFHILPSVHIEVVDERGAACAPGVTGRILVTFLGSPSFPLIRYEIEDIGALRAGSCACGRPFEMLERVEGRAADFLVSTTGGHVSPVYIRHLIGVVHNPGTIRRFQLIQHDDRRFELLLEPESGAAAQIEAVRGALTRDLLAVLGSDAQLDFCIVERIEETATGKFRYTVRIPSHQP